MERRILGLSLGQSATICSLWNAGKRAAVYPYTWRRSRGYCELIGTGRGRICRALESLGLERKDIEFGNDAPRGGAEGKWIRLTPSGWRKIKRMLTEETSHKEKQK